MNALHLNVWLLQVTIPVLCGHKTCVGELSRHTETLLNEMTNEAATAIKTSIEWLSCRFDTLVTLVHTCNKICQRRPLFVHCEGLRIRPICRHQ